MSTVSRTPDEQPLIGSLVTTLFANSVTTTNRLLELADARIEAAEAELYAIRHGVDQLLAGKWMPTPDAIREAVFEPSQKLIEEYKANKEVGW